MKTQGMKAPGMKSQEIKAPGAKPPTALLEIEGLNHFFGGLHAVRELNFSVRDGSIKALIGPNGAGKTTLFNLIAGNIRPQSGQILLQGLPITGLRPFRIAELGVSRTFQTTKLFPHMSVLENVMIGRHCRSRAGFFSCILNLPWTWKEEHDLRESALNILQSLELGHIAAEQADNLSFGQKRLVEIARALATEPKLLLLDEPAAGLNIYETGLIAELIRTLRSWGITILVVEHDMSLIMDVAEEIVVLNYGEKLAEGKPEEIQRNPEVIRTYLGEDHA